MTQPSAITLDLPTALRRSRFLIACGALGNAGPLILDSLPASFSRRVVVVMDAAIASTHGRRVLESLTAAGVTATAFPLHTSEKDKNLASLDHVLQALHAARLDRRSAVVAVGGGITGDLAGFAASIWMRGISVIQIPTTLLAMVDASVGGKTGVNLALPDGSLRKNLIGTFHQPALVLADPDTLATLPPRHFRSGLAECLKHALLADDELLASLEQSASSLSSFTGAALEQLILRNVRIKVDVVRRDESETGTGDDSGGRMKLNLGHTFAHALEAHPELDLLHGEAVGLGLIACAAAAAALGVSDPALTDRLRRILEAMRLPTRVPSAHAPSADALCRAMLDDKKALSGSVRLLLPTTGRPQRIVVVPDASPAVILAGWRALGVA